jgi:hypothetical protein
MWSLLQFPITEHRPNPGHIYPAQSKENLSRKTTPEKKSAISGLFFSLVIRIGFKPMTHSLEGCCSIQLSYRTITTICRIFRIDGSGFYKSRKSTNSINTG